MIDKNGKIIDEEIINVVIDKAKQGDVVAQRNLGYVYGFNNDYEKSFYWFNKATEQGDVEAICRLGNLYFEGEGVLKDLDKALDLFDKAAKKGDASGQYFLARCMEISNKDNNIPLQIHTLNNYQLSATQGHILAQFRLGEMHLYGTGVEKSLKHSALWLNLVRNNITKDSNTKKKAEKLWEEYKLSDYDF